MTQEVLKLALEALELHLAHHEHGCVYLDPAVTAIKEALAQPEPVKIAHKHEWFRTGEMKVGQMRCISCGTWGQEEIPQRTWVGLTNQERSECWETVPELAMKKVEAKLKAKNEH